MVEGDRHRAGGAGGRASLYRNFSSVEDLVDYGIRQVTQRYHEGMPTTDGNPRSRERIEYQFRFYQEHASLVLGFHRAKASTSLLDLVTDCEISSHGDMSASSPERYQLYSEGSPTMTRMS